VSVTRVSRNWSIEFDSSVVVVRYEKAPTITLVTRATNAKRTASRERRLTNHRPIWNPPTRTRSLPSGLRCRPHDIADAANRVEKAAFAVVFELATQVPDMDVERLRRRLEVISPDVFVDLAS